MLNINKTGVGSQSLVLFHGWGFNQTIWLSLAPLLSAKFTLYLVDLPGFGQSSLMPWDEFKSNLLNELPLKFAVLGWSLGGLFAIRLAYEASNRVSALINVASSPYFVKNEDWPGIEQKQVNQFLYNLSQNPKRTTSEFISLQLRHTNNVHSHEFLSSYEGLIYGLTILATWDLRDVLKKIEVPCCFMFGKLDTIIPHCLLPKMKNLYPTFNYLLFHKAAHLPFMTNEIDFIHALENFFL